MRCHCIPGKQYAVGGLSSVLCSCRETGLTEELGTRDRLDTVRCYQNRDFDLVRLAVTRLYSEGRLWREGVDALKDVAKVELDGGFLLTRFV